MLIRRKLQILSLATVCGLVIILVGVLWGISMMREAESTALRRESYSLQLERMKSAAGTTILLDPSLKTTQTILRDAEATVDKLQTQITATIRRPEIREKFVAIVGQWNQYAKAFDALVVTSATDPDAARNQTDALYEKQYLPFSKTLDEFVAVRLDEAQKDRARADQVATNTIRALVALIVAITIANAILVIVFSRSLQRGLSGINRQLTKLRAGDLTEKLPDAGHDELALIATGVNEVIAEMRSILRGATTEAADVSATAKALSDIAHRVAESSAAQSDSASSTAAAIEEMSVSVASIAETTTEVRRLSCASLDDAVAGDRSIAELQAELAKVQSGVETIADHVRDFIESTTQIAGMTLQIREIADQTNLLALNAAIEAARAGEQGRGFAVVADEVRKLAERSSGSAGEITRLTEALGGKSTAVGQSVDNGLESLGVSLRFVEKLSAVLSSTARSVQAAKSGVDDVATSIQEQRSASANIARNVESISQMADANRISSEESSTSTAHLEQQASTLLAMIERFKV